MTNLEKIVHELSRLNKINNKKLRSLQSRYPKHGNELYSKSEILGEFNRIARLDLYKSKREDVKKQIEKPDLLSFLKTKPTRTISGVTPVTALTKPYKCPGNCVFCPTESGQPKSYLSTEPGAMRAQMLKFDPFNQVRVRMQALENIGHNTEKIELIILGGTWSAYPKKYQVWFIKECFRAMNSIKSERFKAGAIDPVASSDQDCISKNQLSRFGQFKLKDLQQMLLAEHKKNEVSKHRCVGLVIETRPDCIDEEHVKWLRFLGATKIQIGVQSLDDKLLKLNQRGHTVADTKRAIKILRLGGFKLHLHWMLNLYGSDPKNDLVDFGRLFKDEAIRPDELKIYPCMLLKNTQLYKLYLEGKYKPYTSKQLLELLIKCKIQVPVYCRISRLFRDIPSFEVVKGVKETNFRQIVQEEMKKRNLECNCIRCREIRNSKFKYQNLQLTICRYDTSVGKEFFIIRKDENGKLLGFVRLSLPDDSNRNFIFEIQNSAMIREVHVYGIVKQLTDKQLNSDAKNVQHKGVGKELIKNAEMIARTNGYRKISVISAIGTRGYYMKLGYRLGELYMSKNLK
jgi:elongator complex protein 3